MEVAVISAPCPQQLNDVDCGVAICLTALHLISHPDMPRISNRPRFSAETLYLQSLGKHCLKETYWLAGRRIVLELCRPYADVSDEKAKEVLDVTEAAIQSAFANIVESYGCRRTDEMYYDAITARIISNNGRGIEPVALQTRQTIETAVQCAKHCRYVLSVGLNSITLDVRDILDYVRELGTASTVDWDLAIQRQAPQVVLSEDWEQFRRDVVEKAVTYAWHDVEEIKKTQDDLERAANILFRLTQELSFGPGAAGP